MDVGAWLRGLGLGQYEQAFRDNDVDAEVLPDLTADDLIGLGVTSIGHRRKLLAAIAALRQGTPSPKAPPARAEPAPASGTDAPSGPWSPEAERRQLTVMFVDLVGSTALSARSTPRTCKRSCAPTRTPSPARSPASRATWPSYMGDGVLAYFGWPRRTRTTPSAPCGPALPLVGRGPRRSRPRGRTARRAGRHRDRARGGRRPRRRRPGTGGGRRRRDAQPRRPAAGDRGAGQVVVAPDTRQLLGDLFDLEDLGPPPAQAFPGRSAPSGCCASRAGEPLRGAARPRPRCRWSGATRNWRSCSTAGGRPRPARARSCCSSARPGSASRASRRRCSTPWPTSRTRGSGTNARPTTSTARSGPVVHQLDRAAGLEPRDPPGRRLDKLEAILAQASVDVAPVAPLFATLLGIPTERPLPAPRSHAAAAACADAGGAARPTPRAGAGEGRCCGRSRTCTGSTRPRSS